MYKCTSALAFITSEINIESLYVVKKSSDRSSDRRRGHHNLHIRHHQTQSAVRSLNEHTWRSLGGGSVFAIMWSLDSMPLEIDFSASGMLTIESLWALFLWRTVLCKMFLAGKIMSANSAFFSYEKYTSNLMSSPKPCVSIVSISSIMTWVTCPRYTFPWNNWKGSDNESTIGFIGLKMENLQLMLP